MKRAKFTELEQLPNVGPAIAAKLRRIGIRAPHDLIGRDPYVLFEELVRVTGKRHDLCLLDVFISAVRFMAGEPGRPWWAYTSERKARLGTSSLARGAARRIKTTSTGCGRPHSSRPRQPRP